MNRLLAMISRRPVPVLVISAALGAWGIHSALTTPVDALPDVSENQVIIAVEWLGRSPSEVHDHIVLPLTSAVSGLEYMVEVRGISGFGFAHLYAVFQDEADFYQARTRVIEKVEEISAELPEDSHVRYGPDATPLGQIYWYTVDGSENKGFLRDLHDDVIARRLEMVPGVSEVAGVGGYHTEIIVEADPILLWQHGVSYSQLYRAVESSGSNFGAGAFDRSGMEIVVEGLLEPATPQDIGAAIVAWKDGAPLLVSDLANVYTGPAARSGILADHQGETVGGIVTMRMGENPVEVIEGVERELENLRTSLPEGVSINTYYDRRTLIEETTKTLTDAISWEVLITILVVLFFLRRAREALLVAAGLPFAILLCFTVMKLLHVPANIMSYAGIAIAIGTLVDMGIVMVTAIQRSETVGEGAASVSGPILTSLGTTIISFVPVFFLTGQSGKLFTPLALTKTIVLAGAGITAFTFIPAAASMFLKKKPGNILPAISGALGLGLLGGWAVSGTGALQASMVAVVLALLGWQAVREKPESAPGKDLLVRLYRPLLTWCISHRHVFIAFPLLAILLGITALSGLGTRFMPPLDEGSFLYMPSLLPAGSLNEAGRVMVNQNAALASLHEVDRVVGKAGRAETALDPAPVGMIETLITLKPRDQWREGMTEQSILDSLRALVDMPGIAPSWLQPIETRVVMLQSGIKTSIGLEIHGSDPIEAERLAVAIEGVISQVPGAADVSALRTGRKAYARIEVDRAAASALGVPLSEVGIAVRGALGGMVAGEITEGYSTLNVRVRFYKDFRDSIEDLMRVQVVSMTGETIELSSFAEIKLEQGPAAVRSVDGDPVGYVMLNSNGRDHGSLIAEAETTLRDIIENDLELPPEERVLDIKPGYWFRWIGDWENQLEARQRFLLLIPLCLISIFLLMYLQFKTFSVPSVIFAGSVPVSVAGGLIALRIWPGIHGFLEQVGLHGASAPESIDITVAVVVGFIALLGIAVDDGVLMASNISRMVQKNKPGTVQELRATVIEAGVMRIRPAVMTTVTTIIALVPVLLASGRGSTLSRPMAIPVFGGMIFEFLSMLIVPVILCALQEKKLKEQNT